MAYSVNSERVLTAHPMQNVDSSGNNESRGAIVCGEIDITAYAAPEVISAAALGLNVIYGAMFSQSENAEHDFNKVVVASGGKTLSLTADDVGTGTEAGTDNIGTVHFIAWGEALGSGSNV